MGLCLPKTPSFFFLNAPFQCDREQASNTWHTNAQQGQLYAAKSLKRSSLAASYAKEKSQNAAQADKARTRALKHAKQAKYFYK